MDTYKIEVLGKLEPYIIEFKEENYPGMHFSHPTCNGNADVTILTQIVKSSSTNNMLRWLARFTFNPSIVVFPISYLTLSLMAWLQELSAIFSLPCFNVECLYLYCPWIFSFFGTACFPNKPQLLE
jgi:hypothetical protein